MSRDVRRCAIALTVGLAALLLGFGPASFALPQQEQAKSVDPKLLEEIAGNDDIMLTVLSDQPELAGALMSLPRQGYGDTRHLLLVRVARLGDLLRALEAEGLRLEHIHDY